jgi:hypothetical protein
VRDAVAALRSVRLGRRTVTGSLRCSATDSRYDQAAARSRAPNGVRYRTNHYRRYIAPDPGRVLQLTGAFGAQPVTPSEVL